VEEVLQVITTGDVRDPCDVLPATSGETHGLDGRVPRRQADYLTEYGADTYPGMHTLVTSWAEKYLEITIGASNWIDPVVGEPIWNFDGFVTPSGIIRVGGIERGVLTGDRQPNSGCLRLEAPMARPRLIPPHTPLDLRTRKKL